VNKTKQMVLALVAVVVLYALLKVLIVVGIIGPYWQIILNESMIYVIGALGLSIIYGFTGQFSLGHAAFVGIGAYCAGWFAITFSHYGIWASLGSLVVGMVSAGLVGYLIGVPILRLKSDYLGIATLGFNFIVYDGMQNSDKLSSVLGGAQGMTGVPQFQAFEWYFVTAVIVFILVRNLVFSSHGRALYGDSGERDGGGCGGGKPGQNEDHGFHRRVRSGRTGWRPLCPQLSVCESRLLQLPGIDQLPDHRGAGRYGQPHRDGDHSRRLDIPAGGAADVSEPAGAVLY
jgi:hypothetical protein